MMNFRDQWATDDKGQRFIFTVEMQRQLFELGKVVDSATWLQFRQEAAPPSAPKRGERPKEEAVATPVLSAEEAIDPATGKQIGTLKDYNRAKGFGFIRQADGTELYFHKRQALDNPEYMGMGQKLLYNITVYRGKEEAVEVEEFE